MVGVTINSGQLPSAIGLNGNALLKVLQKWQSIADGRFPEDCSALLQMVDETDKLQLWKKKIGGFSYRSRNEFLKRRVLIDFKLTERALTSIVSRLRPSGNTAAAALRRLRKDRPDIHQKVLAGELSPHAGMVKAGFRKKIKNKKLTSLQRIVKLLPQLSNEERLKLRQILTNEATP